VTALTFMGYEKLKRLGRTVIRPFQVGSRSQADELEVGSFLEENKIQQFWNDTAEMVIFYSQTATKKAFY